MRQNAAEKQEACDMGKRLKREKRVGNGGKEVYGHDQGWGHGQEGGVLRA